jgi:uracil phosphoribosyltransferase
MIINRKPEFGGIVHEFDRLTSFEDHLGVQQLLFNIRSEKEGGEKFKKSLFTLGFIMGNHWLHKHGQVVTQQIEAPYGEITKPAVTNPPVIVIIPRGGKPLGEGVSLLLQDSLLFSTNAGKNKDSERTLLPQGFPVH